ncbi:MAG: HlyC/CorC family transporter [Ardenticatenaceae bacterium]|nr:HlyC/CorC family transporter [Anaerolineales bacterium]MCB8982369.1 HlyC/CorC family transporter [Ardenticatenaceae bacterium]MCB8986302.1 HlyC/CorC family transporter [Ardenticatenaceae bacterium]
MIFVNGLYVAAEFATVSSRRTRISQMAGSGNKMAEMLRPIMENTAALDAYVAACQIGITISSLVLGAYGQNVIAGYLVAPLSHFTNSAAAAQSLSFIIVLVFITMLQVILGELFPKSVAIQYPENLALALVIPMRISLILFRPLIWLFNGSGSIVLRLLGRQPSEGAQFHSPEEIELLVTESHESGLLDAEERQMLRNAFRLRDLHARQVMVHRTRLVAAPIESQIEELINLAIAEGYSRIPIYHESVDEITGFVHIKDLFRLYLNGESDVSSVLRDVIYVPETMPVADLWQKLNVDRKYLAIVFDEYGGTAGLITFEDLIEEIFGELQDEFDDEMALIARDQNGRVYLRGDLLVSDVNEYLELNLPTEADTLSGLVFSVLGRPPTEGEVVVVGETQIRVEAMADLGVSEVSLQLPPLREVTSFSEWEVADHD